MLAPDSQRDKLYIRRRMISLKYVHLEDEIGEELRMVKRFIKKYIRKQQIKHEEEEEWHKFLDKMPIGFIEKYVHKKKLNNIKKED